MKPPFSSLFLALLASVGPCAHAETIAAALQRTVPVPANEPIPVVDFFRPRLFREPELNPTGTHFAALVSTAEDEVDAVIYDFAAKKFERLSGWGESDIYQVEWLSDRALRYSISTSRNYYGGSWVVELDRLRRSYELEEWRRWQDRPQTGKAKKAVYVPAALNRLHDDESRALRDFYRDHPDDDVLSFMPDKDGRFAFATLLEGDRVRLYRRDGTAWTKCPVDCDEIAIVGAGDRKDELIVVGPRQEGQPRALQRMDAATGELGEIVLQLETHDPVNVQLHRDPMDGRVVGVHYVAKIWETLWLDSDFAAVQAGLEKVFPEKLVQITGTDLEKKQFFVAVWSDREPVRYYLYNRETRRLATVASSAPWIDPERMFAARTLAFQARDGVKLEGYVTLPKTATKETPAPLVVLPHGGPWARNVWTWDDEAQFLASRGYAVFQPNYRGSSGYGWRAPKDDEWAFDKMHQDVTDGVKTLLQTGLIDRQRIAIMGWSFGGYLSACGAAFEPELYRCAISLAAVFDWERLMKEAKNRDRKAEFLTLRRFLGDPRKEREKFEQISPLRHADKINVPMFIAHGRDDSVVSVTHSKKLASALHARGVPIETQFEAGEGHGFRRLENRVQLYSAIETFLQQHLAPRAAR